MMESWDAFDPFPGVTGNVTNVVRSSSDRSSEAHLHLHVVDSAVCEATLRQSVSR